jgi:uncharacterized protein (TIGR00255 family)
MIRSMTGYGRAEVSGARLSVLVECKSLNHRSLDVSLRLPGLLSAFELEARRMVQSAVQRGRVEVSVRLGTASGASVNPLVANVDQAREYATLARQIGDALGLPAPRLEWVLGQPGVLTREAEPAAPPEEAWSLLADALTRALAEMVARRETEGAALAQDLAALHDTLTGQVALMAERVPLAAARQTTRMRERMQALLGEAPIDEGRVLTEVAAWAARSDIAEELARLAAHLAELARMLREGGVVGRALDFLIQELNREVNTVGSKADDLELSQLVIAAKSTLEKLREQVQNIE